MLRRQTKLTQVLKYQNKTIACRELLLAYMYAFKRKPASCSTRISKRTTLTEKPYMRTFLIITNGLRSTKLSKSIRLEHLHSQVVFLLWHWSGEFSAARSGSGHVGHPRWLSKPCMNRSFSYVNSPLVRQIWIWPFRASQIAVQTILLYVSTRCLSARTAGVKRERS